MSHELQKKIFKFCKKINIKCFSSPFDEKSVDFLEDLNCPVYKLASPEIAHLPLIKRIAKTKKPLLISTGMAQINEIKDTYKFAKKNSIKDISILYCVSNYPSQFYDFNMNNLKILKETFDCPIGFSDHSMDNDVVKAAIMMGATIVEKHFALKKNFGIDSKFSSTIEDLKIIKNESKTIWKSLGKINYNGKKIDKSSIKFKKSSTTSENFF